MIQDVTMLSILLMKPLDLDDQAIVMALCDLVVIPLCCGTVD